MPSVWIESRPSKHGKNYKVRWEIHQEGRRLRGEESCGPLKRVAEQLRASKIEELFAAQTGIDFTRPNTGWSQFAQAYLEHCRQHKAPNTVRNFDSRAMTLAADHFGHLSPATIRAQDISEWETALLKKYNPTTTRMWLRCLRTALRWGQANAYLKSVPPINLPRIDPVGHVLTDQEVEGLLGAMAPSARPAVIFALYTGLRRGELLGLEWSRIRQTQEGHWEAEIGGVGGPRTKTGKSRVIPLHPAAVAAMGPRRAQGRVFAALSEEVSHQVQNAARVAGLGRVRFHDLRHTWATRYMQATGDLFGLMALGGWSNMGSVRVYQHMTKTRGASALAVNFPPISPQIEPSTVGD
jgi:integrase